VKGIFNVRLKELREKAGYSSQQSFADAFGVAQSTVGNWEAGKREPNYETTKKLARFFKVSIDYLLGVKEDDMKSYFSVNEVKDMKFGSPQPVSDLCSLYGITPEVFKVICNGEYDPLMSDESWVTGIFSLRPTEDVLKIYPRNQMLIKLSQFFEVSSRDLSEGGELSCWPKASVQKKVDDIKEKIFILRFKRFQELNNITDNDISSEIASITAKKAATKQG